MPKLLQFPKPDYSRRDALFAEYQHLVEPAARWFAAKLSPSFDLDDLRQAACLGLLAAAARFDERKMTYPEKRKGSLFTKYARWKIRGAILDSIRRANYIESTHLRLEQEVELENLADERLHPEVLLERIEQRERIEEALELLPQREQKLIQQHYLAEREQVEIARELQVVPSAVSHLHKSAIRNLRKNVRMRQAVKLTHEELLSLIQAA